MVKRLIIIYCFIFAIITLYGCSEIILEDLSTIDIKYQFVNLKTAADRKKSMEDQLTLAQVRFEPLDAVYGKELSEGDIDILVNGGIYDGNTRSNNPLLPGELGVFLSTLQKALPNAVASTNSITVTFEDDVVVPNDVETQFRQALKLVPSDWDILYLGCYQNYLVRLLDSKIIGPYTPTTLEEAQEYKYPLCEVDRTRQVYGTPWIQLDGGCVAGMYAYAVRSVSAQKLMDILVPIKKAVDITITSLVGNGLVKAYCLNPELIRVNTTIPSTIR